MNLIMLFFCLNISALVCSLAAVIYCAVRFIRKKQGIYFKIATMGIALFALAFIFCGIYAGLAGGSSTGFTIGYLAMIGAFLFLFTSNRSYISVLEDANTKHKKRSTVLALIMPIVLFAEFAAAAVKIGLSYSLIPPFLLFVASSASSYFAFREVLLPDIKNGFIDCMRPFNLATCILAVICSACELVYVYVQEVSFIPYIILAVLGDLALVLLAITLCGGIKKWVS